MESDKFFYANAIEIAVTPYDFNLNFLRQGSPKNAQAGMPVPAETLEKLIVSMSPQHAKAMAAGIFLAVTEYEKTVGPITLIKEQQVKFESAFGPLLAKK